MLTLIVPILSLACPWGIGTETVVPCALAQLFEYRDSNFAPHDFPMAISVSQILVYNRSGRKKTGSRAAAEAAKYMDLNFHKAFLTFDRREREPIARCFTEHLG